jgi:Fic family protein
VLNPVILKSVMFQKRRIRRAHARFLRACRSLKDGRDRWDATPSWARRLVDCLVPGSLLALGEEGRPLLQALDWLEEHCREATLGEEALRQYHRLALEGRIARPGVYRTEPVTIVGSQDQPPGPARVASLMKQWDLDVAEAQRTLDAGDAGDREKLLRASLETYRKLGWIHPFPDGNGRVARLAMNHLLRRYGAGYVILPPISEAPDLLEALTQAHRGNLELLARTARKNWILV